MGKPLGELSYKNEIVEILAIADEVINGLKGHTLDVLDISAPPDLGYAQHLAKVVSKLSPLVGNMIEYSIANILNQRSWEKYHGTWIRQDPDFPDNLFLWDKPIKPGIEVKMWFPLATEITARFKDSEKHFRYDQTNVAVIAWLPEYIIYGKPKILDVFIDSGKSLAAARDRHYHRPPHYLVFEPEDTSARTRNLQQTNTNGYVYQGTDEQFQVAKRHVAEWGPQGQTYSSQPEYQAKLQDLRAKYRYRLDTNYAKIDRIEHEALETFKTKVLSMNLFGSSILQWSAEIMSDRALVRLLKAKG